MTRPPSPLPSPVHSAALDRAVDILARLPGLAKADAKALTALAEQFDAVTFKDGELICKESAPAQALYVLARGRVDIRKRSLSGRVHTMATLHAPCLFGHVGVLSLAERTASVRARGDVVVLQMSARRARVVLRTGDFRVASPFRRALIVAMCSQLTSATASVARLAVDANVAEEWHTPPDGRVEASHSVRGRPKDEAEDDRDESENSTLPDDAEERLMKGISQV